MSPRLLALFGAALLAAPALAQIADADTTRALGEVVVGGAEPLAGVEAIPVAGVLARDAASVADVARLVPSAVAPTNSRGETLLYLRGAGERQTAVLFDGAPLTVPWDRRVDLALVPAGLVEAARVVRGPASVVWGPNAAGGAVDLVPRGLERDGALTEAEASGGVPGQGRLGAVHLRRRGAWSLSAGLDASASGDDALAEPLPFSQPGDLRTNTDRRRLGGLARVAYAPRPRAGRPEAGAALTVLHVSAAQGVAPEGHLDPAEARVRFWRIPAWRQTTLIASGHAPAGPAGLRATAWLGAFDQTIDQFDDADYAAPTGGQLDRDRTAGARLVAETVGPAGLLRVLAHGHVSEHEQRDGPKEEVFREPEVFREAEWRLGAEAERTVGPARVLLGAALDGFEPLETAGRAASGGFGALALSARLDAPLGPEVAVVAGVARDARFPSMRELFGEALGRFALNPDLRPERSWQAEVGARRTGRRLSGRATAFARWTDGTIEQETQPDGRRRRVNLGGSRAVGVEAEGAARLGVARIDVSGTLLYARARTEAERGLRLTERPGALGRLAVTVLPPRGWTAAAEVLLTGSAVSLGPDGLVDLPASAQVGVRAGHRWVVGRGLVEAFARVDNATDALVLPQAGLPAPGRTLRLGLRVLR
ncbi:MAG: TonB-dependent receptor, partial [Bacteroidota bacterium]